MIGKRRCAGEPNHLTGRTKCAAEIVVGPHRLRALQTVCVAMPACFTRLLSTSRSTCLQRQSLTKLAARVTIRISTQRDKLLNGSIHVYLCVYLAFVVRNISCTRFQLDPILATHERQ